MVRRITTNHCGSPNGTGLKKDLDIIIRILTHGFSFERELSADSLDAPPPKERMCYRVRLTPGVSDKHLCLFLRRNMGRQPIHKVGRHSVLLAEAMGDAEDAGLVTLSEEDNMLRKRKH